MRIIAGEYRRRKLLSPPETAQTRPIPDRVKEALFNLLRGNVEGAVVVDVFAGTGPIGLEAISRGAASCAFVEKDRRVAGILRQNIETLGCGDRCDVIVTDALGSSLEHRLPERIDLLFFDPPYPLMTDERSAQRVLGQFQRLVGRLSDDGFAMLRTPWPYLVGAAERGSGDAAREAEAGEPAARRGRGPRRRGREVVEEVVEEIDLDDEAGEVAKPVRRPGSLKVPGAVGPECHPYGSTALQLYMRERESGGDSGEAAVQSTP